MVTTLGGVQVSAPFAVFLISTAAVVFLSIIDALGAAAFRTLMIVGTYTFLDTRISQAASDIAPVISAEASDALAWVAAITGVNVVMALSGYIVLGAIALVLVALVLSGSGDALPEV